MKNYIETIRLRIKRSGVRIAPGAPLFPLDSAPLRVNTLSCIPANKSRFWQVIGKLCQNTAIMVLLSFPAHASNLKTFPKWEAVIARMDSAAESAMREAHKQNFMRYKQIEDKADYWKTPAEFYKDGGGDCEDFAIALYFKALSLGIRESDMAIVVGIKLLSESKEEQSK